MNGIWSASSLRVGGVALVALAATACSTGPATIAPANGSVTLSGALSGTFDESATPGCGATASSGPTVFNGDINFHDISLRFLGFSGSNNMPLGGNGLGLITIDTASGSWSAGQDAPMSLGTLTLSQHAGGVIQGSVNATLIPLQGSTQTLHVTGHWFCRS